MRPATNIDERVVNAPELPPELQPPSAEEVLNFLRETRMRRAAWLVGVVDSGVVPAPQIAKAAGYKSLAAFYQGLHRARRMVGWKKPEENA